MKKSKIPWRKSQQETIALVGGVEQPGGGVVSGYGGDGKSATHLIEHKYTNKDHLRIKKEWLIKIWKEATLCGLEPMFTCELGNGEKFKATVEGVGDWFAHHNISFILRSSSCFPSYTSFDGKILWRFERL